MVRPPRSDGQLCFIDTYYDVTAKSVHPGRRTECLVKPRVSEVAAELPSVRNRHLCYRRTTAGAGNLRYSGGANWHALCS
jgi:hypothetical protein